MLFQADLVAIPSCTEGFGLVCLESISAGVPMLVTSQSGIAKALKNAKGETAVVVESKDPGEWAQKIKMLSQKNPEELDTTKPLVFERAMIRHTHGVHSVTDLNS